MTEAVDHGFRTFSARRLSPFHGLLEIVEDDWTRAVSVDGVHWQIQIRHAMTPPKAGGQDGPRRAPRFARYGQWTRHSGLRRQTLPPELRAESFRIYAERLTAYLRNAAFTLPFPVGDPLELWLLDRDNLPLALVASAQTRDRLPQIRVPQWVAALPYAHLQPDTAPEESLNAELDRAVSRLISRATENRAQWFERGADGRGSGITGVGPTPAMPERSLPSSAFSMLPIREWWDNPAARHLVARYHAWQSPGLLMLRGLDDARRYRLECEALHRPFALYRAHRLYPRILQPARINKALVEVELRMSNPRPG